MKNNQYIDELYEKYEENFTRSKKYQNIAEKLAQKYEEIENKFTKNQLKDIDEFEKYLSSLLEIEVKEAFKKGFEAGKKLSSEDKMNSI